MKSKASFSASHPPKPFQVLFLTLILTLLLTACQASATATPDIARTGTFPVDSLFNEYYQGLGGENQLGPVISPLFEQEGLKCQYTVAVLMCLDPEVTGSTRYRMAALGVRIGIHEAPPGGAQSETSQVVDGYAIYPGFVKLISSLHGIDGVGKPLSNPRYNYAQQRVEQYFENAAFYYRFDDPSGKVNMLPYGWYYCGRTCHYEVSEDNRAFNPVIQPLDTPFAPALENIGGLRVFGQIAVE